VADLPPDTLEFLLGGRWWVFDPRKNAPRIGRILVAQGRDAVDAPLVHFFGQNLIRDFRAWVDKSPDLTPFLRFSL
jgi:transglutaminase-like putative cysteine protease